MGISHPGLIEALVTAALDVLHHDRSEGSPVDEYERERLRKKFREVINGKQSV